MDKTATKPADLLNGFPEPEGNDIQIFSWVAIKSAHGTHISPLRQNTIPDGLDVDEAGKVELAMLQAFANMAVSPFKSLTLTLTHRSDPEHPALKALLPRPPIKFVTDIAPAIHSMQHTDTKELKLESTGQFMFPWKAEDLRQPSPPPPPDSAVAVVEPSIVSTGSESNALTFPSVENLFRVSQMPEEVLMAPSVN